MELAFKFANNFLTLLDAMSIYIMVGLLIAGILKQLIPDNFVSSHLGKDSTSSVIKATLFGIPLPVCSCSVIPLAQGLRKEGASKGAVQSFLISTPITGVDSILATFSLFGFVFTLFRVVSSIIIAIAVGLIQNFIQKDDKEVSPVIETSCGCTLYTCATASLPIAAAFMLQGMSPGAVFIFLTAGPATSAVTMSVVYKMLGRTSLIVYTVVIAVLALLFGYGYDTFFQDLSIISITLDNGETSLINSLASLMMLVLIFYHLFKSKFSKKSSDCCGDEHAHEDTNSSCNATASQTGFSVKPPVKGSGFSLTPKNK